MKTSPNTSGWIWRFCQGLAPLAILAAATPIAAQTITVTTGEDLVDINTFTGSISDLPGPDGLVSFSEAMIASNNTPGRQVIGFGVPQADWPLQNLFPGRLVLTTLDGFYWRATDAVTIDGRTQTALTGDTFADGAEVTTFGSSFSGSIYLNAPGGEVYGLHDADLQINGGGGIVQACTGLTHVTIFGSSGTLVGGTGAGEGNGLGVVKIDQSDDNVVVGNVMLRARVLGFVSEFGTGPATGNRIGGLAPGEGNVIRGTGFWSSQGVPSGDAVQLFDTSGTLILGNTIGLAPGGLVQASTNCTAGINMSGVNDDTLVEGNTIAGILASFIFPSNPALRTGYAVLVGGSGQGLTIRDNTIGLNEAGEPLGSLNGIDVGSVSFATLSGVLLEGNVVASHKLNGIVVGRSMQGVTARENLAYDNASMAIDLALDSTALGPTDNDPLDPDIGGNGLQNFPVMLAAAVNEAGLFVEASLASTPSATFDVEFFADSSCGEDGRGQARQFLAREAGVQTDAAGDASIMLELPGIQVPQGWVVSATATNVATGSTSEVGPCATVTLRDSAVADWSRLED